MSYQKSSKKTVYTQESTIKNSFYNIYIEKIQEWTILNKIRTNLSNVTKEKTWIPNKSLKQLMSNREVRLVLTLWKRLKKWVQQKAATRKSTINKDQSFNEQKKQGFFTTCWWFVSLFQNSIIFYFSEIAQTRVISVSIFLVNLPH